MYLITDLISPAGKNQWFYSHKGLKSHQLWNANEF